jgi:hypothetical protein
MNERIKSLIELAEYQVQKQSGSDWQVHIEPSREQIFEKFAELIVKKCTKLIEQSIEDDEYWSRTTGAESIMAIEEHFGVEE